MKLHPEDPRITAYVLGELKPEDAAAVEAAAAADPAVQAAIDEMDGLGQLLTDTLFATKPTLRPAHRQKILQAARHPETIGKVVRISDHRPSWKPWVASIAAAALLMFAVIIFTKVPVMSPQADGSKPAQSEIPQTASTEGESWRTIPIEIALLPAPGPVDASRPVLARNLSGSPSPASLRISKFAAARNEAVAKQDGQFLKEVAEKLKTSPPPAASELPVLTRRGPVVASVTPNLELPIQAGSASLSWISHSVREEHKLPPVNAVRIEEILNHFTLRPAGAAAVSQGVTLSTETLPCPWKPSASLLIIAFRGATDSAREIQASFKADPEKVARYRLLGFSPVAGVPDGSLPTHLPAKALTLVAIEIEPINGATSFGSVEWTVNQQPAAEIALTRKPGAEPSDDARFASLLCTYAQWLAGDQSGMIDGEIVAALAREMASDQLPPDRFDFLNLVDQSLNL